MKILSKDSTMKIYVASNSPSVIINNNILSKVNFSMTQKECELVDNGLLMKGLRTAIVSVVLSCNDMIS